MHYQGCIWLMNDTQGIQYRNSVHSVQYRNGSVQELSSIHSTISTDA